ncbi:MAG: hypothetical protein A4E53_01578 [Pelotomaculum sp. PtaB.Bin104]|nr:MAG: hypothetical protein A4E53_01578 [Pelotomaculum sp. PtaB.Bin104]
MTYISNWFNSASASVTVRSILFSLSSDFLALSLSLSSISILCPVSLISCAVSFCPKATCRPVCRSLSCFRLVFNRSNLSCSLRSRCLNSWLFFSRSANSSFFASTSAFLIRISFVLISRSLARISPFFSRIAFRSSIFFLVLLISSSSSFKDAILLLSVATSIGFSERMNLLMNSFTLSMGLKASDFGIMSKNRSSRFPSLCPNLALASDIWEISMTFLSFLRNSSAVDGLPPVKKLSSSNLHSSRNHLMVSLLSSSGESIFTPRVKYLAVFSSKNSRATYVITLPVRIKALSSLPVLQRT